MAYGRGLLVLGQWILFACIISNTNVIWFRPSSMAYENHKLFRDIAQTRSMSRAAAMNGISQSAATQQIQDLEKSFATELLDRSRRPLALTEAGQIYAQFCRDVLRRREDFLAELARVRQETDARVRVASIYSVGLGEMVDLEQEFSARHPEATLEVEYLRPEKVYEAVLADEDDIGLALSSAGRARAGAAGRIERHRVRRLRRGSAHPARDRPLFARARRPGEPDPALRQSANDQGSRGASRGSEHHARAHHAGGAGPGAAGGDSHRRLGAVPPAGNYSPPEKKVPQGRAGVYRFAL